MELEYGVTKEQILAISTGRGGARDSEYRKVVKAFIESGADAARIKLSLAKKEISAYSALRYAVKRHGLPVKVISRNKELYLLRND